MKFKSKVAALILAVTLPVSQASYGMNAQQQSAPNIIGMFSNVIDFVKRNEALSIFVGGIAAFAAYKILTHESGERPVRKNNGQAHSTSSGQAHAAGNLRIQEGIQFLVQHAQQAGRLFQAGRLPSAYLHGKYCEIAKQVGFDRLPDAERKALAQAVFGFDVAFKQKAGMQEALQAAGGRLQAVLGQLQAKYGAHQQSAEARAGNRQARSTSPVGGIFQALIDQVKANPMGTLSLIASSGYALLAQFNGWPPYGSAAPQGTPQSGSTR